MITAQRMYDYEYLGCSGRLVVTPLTDRCYRTLMGAIQLMYGGAPEGPAGTGKTETVKDLGKAVAVQTVVFNCSDGLDYKIMGRFFSGLAQAGAWACFDEFNRIDIEVLSVIAQQCLSIARALSGRVSEFDFEGRIIPINRKYGAFITMNPGYAGRTELPDNLKALFRPVAMMVPDYALIAEIMLFSEGFDGSKPLARKMTQLYRLASEQLSSQSHYDFGMRAVKSVLVMAGQLKRSNPDLREDIVLIRALRDSNVPKFLAEDLPIFFAIILDLFPGVTVPNVDYGELQDAIESRLSSNGLQRVPAFISKIIQLFETLQVRHGVMVVGVTMTGKTTMFKILQEALIKLHADGVPHPRGWYENVIVHRLNPKSITMYELYGNFDLMTNEWTDGLVALIIRDLLNESPDRKWVIFDGPVDAIWIENMNTVLDDNKTLCLANGERIKMPATVATMFEVNDLAVASPATVSRCGMVFVEPKYLSWVPLSQTWMAKMEKQGRFKGLTEVLTPLLEAIIDPAISLIRRSCKEYIESMDVNLVTTCLCLLESLMYKPPEDGKGYESTGWKGPDPTKGLTAEFLSLFKLHFTFSIIWSLGGNLDTASREKFNEFARSKFELLEVPLPAEGSVYDYVVNDAKIEFESWQERLPEFVYDPAKPFFSIMVPTMDTVRLDYLLNQNVSVERCVLVVGNTGVGKTVVVQEFLSNLDTDVYRYAMANFSAQTSAVNFRDMIEDKLDKRRKNLLGPPSGKKMIIFVDDLNMPVLEEYGAQPPIELLRQIVDNGGFYDQKKVGLFKNVADTQFVMSCGPPGGGRNTLTPRMVRHCHMLTTPDLSTESMERIFQCILGGFLQPFGEEYSPLVNPMVSATTGIYRRISSELLPTPSKSHYTFNLRDLAKVMQGVLQVKPKNIASPEKLVYLWAHESQRVFCDRLVDYTDKGWFIDLLSEMLDKHFKPIVFEKEARPQPQKPRLGLCSAHS